MTALERRFWRKVDRGGADECWPWTGAANASGHGRFMLEDRSIGYAHRVSYELAFGGIPEGFNVCHRCDNPPCVNPTHLFVGTHQQNMADRQAKGRTRTGITTGSKHHATPLTEADVLAIRARLARGERQVHLARDFGVSQAAISAIARRQTWRHVA